jgi:hypothetical protein
MQYACVACTANEWPVRIQYKCLIPIYVFPVIELHGLLFPKHIMFCLPIFTQYLCAIFIHIPGISLPILLQQNRQINPGEYINRSQIHECRNGNKAAHFHFWEYLNRIFGAVCSLNDIADILRAYFSVYNVYSVPLLPRPSYRV